MNTWRQHQLGRSKLLPLFNNQFFHPIFSNDNGYRVAFFDKFSRITEQHEIGNPHPGVTRRWPHGPPLAGTGTSRTAPVLSSIKWGLSSLRKNGMDFSLSRTLKRKSSMDPAAVVRMAITRYPGPQEYDARQRRPLELRRLVPRGPSGPEHRLPVDNR